MAAWAYTYEGAGHTRFWNAPKDNSLPMKFYHADGRTAIIDAETYKPGCRLCAGTSCVVYSTQSGDMAHSSWQDDKLVGIKEESHEIIEI